MPNWFANRRLRIGALVGVWLIGLVLLFCLGVVIGARAFRPFGHGAIFRIFEGQQGHGAVGTVVTINGNTITVSDQDGSTDSVSVSASTRIETGVHHRGSLQDIRPGTHILVLGSPAGPMIQARFIRVMQ